MRISPIMQVWQQAAVGRHARFACAFMLLFFSYLPSRGEQPNRSVPLADRSVAEILLRLPDFDLWSRPDLMKKLDRYLRANQGTTRYFQLIRQFELTDRSDELLQIALSRPGTTPATWAAETLVRFDQRGLLEQATQHVDTERATASVRALASVGDAETLAFFKKIIARSDTPGETRNAIATALADQPEGETFLAKWVAEKNLPSQLSFTVGNLLHSSQNAAHREIAARHLPRPETSGGEPLPSMKELLVRRGDRDHGRVLFFSKAQCGDCHRVAQEGKSVGPNLTEIGSKLSKESLYTSILDPSAAISHNYENHEMVTVDGKIENGILLSRDATGITLKNSEGVVFSFPHSKIENFRTLPLSLMPDGIEKKLTVQELIDLVQFLTSLKNNR